MDSTSGPESARFSRENLPNNANRDGINGWTPASKKQSGQEEKMKNYFSWLVSFPVNGVP